MDAIYPKRCEKNVKKLMDILCSDAEIVYNMMLMTATLMDLRPEDDKVAELILLDCEVEVQ